MDNVRYNKLPKRINFKDRVFYFNKDLCRYQILNTGQKDLFGVPKHYIIDAYEKDQFEKTQLSKYEGWFNRGGIDKETYEFLAQAYKVNNIDNCNNFVFKVFYLSPNLDQIYSYFRSFGKFGESYFNFYDSEEEALKFAKHYIKKLYLMD